MKQPLDDILRSLRRIEVVLERIAAQIEPLAVMPEWTPEQWEEWQERVNRFNPRR